MQADTFETKLETSKEILNKLMDPSITLEESMKLYEQGLQAIKEATQMIEEAKVKIKMIEQNNHEQ
ncbi:MAG: exodeoxyribonuclease VII small subunit [Campylobacterales bacterium]|nr:exodeoxyribonuclease VII small subunit [Campylobacterales bacterium]